MITRPSIQELIDGVARNLERLTPATAADMPGLILPFLGVMDRLGNEWSGWSALLAADNEDIRATLAGLGIAAPPAEGEVLQQALASLTAQQAVARMEAENRSLKQALADAIESLDLPAGPGATPAQQAADQAILALLRRSLHRETQVVVAPARVAPTSGNPSSSSLTPAQVSETLGRFLADALPGAEGLQIRQLQRLSGGASREAWIFDLHWREHGAARFEVCILMREPVASVLVSDSSPDRIDGTRRTVASEVRAVRAIRAAGLPVPDILWADPVGEWLGRPFSIARRISGTTDTASILGTPAAATMLDQYVDLLGRIHALDPAAVGVDFLGKPTAHTAALEQIELFEGNYRAQQLEAFPATTYLIRWLRKNQPVARHVGVVHGDYRLGNFLFEGDRIMAVIDWEQVHIGDPLEEIAFMYWSLWSLEPVCPIEDFVLRYEAKTGTAVDRAALAYYRVFIEFKMLVVLLTSLKSYFASPERQLHYGGAQTNEMIRDAQLRVIEELARSGPTVAFDAYQKIT